MFGESLVLGAPNAKQRGAHRVGSKAAMQEYISKYTVLDRKIIFVCQES